MRGPAYKGSLTGGIKSLFRLPPNESPRPRLVLAEAAIDALSLAAIEGLRPDTLYAATGGGMGPDTIAALEALLASVAMLHGALLVSATDANGPGDRFAERHRSLAEQFAIPFNPSDPALPGKLSTSISATFGRSREFSTSSHNRQTRHIGTSYAKPS